MIIEFQHPGQLFRQPKITRLPLRFDIIVIVVSLWNWRLFSYLAVGFGTHRKFQPCNNEFPCRLRGRGHTLTFFFWWLAKCSNIKTRPGHYPHTPKIQRPMTDFLVNFNFQTSSSPMHKCLNNKRQDTSTTYLHTFQILSFHAIT